MKTKNMEMVNHLMVNQIIDREHVSTSPRKLIRLVRSKLRTRPDKDGLKYLTAAVFNRWAHNMWEYKYVMGTVPRKYPKFKARYLWDEENRKVVIDAN